MPKQTYLLQIEVQVEAPLADVTTYVKDAIVGWGGAFPPSNPFHVIESRHVKIRTARRKAP